MTYAFAILDHEKLLKPFQELFPLSLIYNIIYHSQLINLSLSTTVKELFLLFQI